MSKPDEADAITERWNLSDSARRLLAREIRALVDAKLSQAATIASVAMYADRALAERAWDAIRSLKMGDEL
jgi:hypothetical protein